MCSSTIRTDARRTLDAFVQFQHGPIFTVRRENLDKEAMHIDSIDVFIYLNAIVLAIGTDDVSTGVDEQSRWIVHFSVGSAVTTEHRRTMEVEVITNARAVDQTATCERDQSCTDDESAEVSYRDQRCRSDRCEQRGNAVWCSFPVEYVL